jgi:cytoskeletal protein RodZ
MSNIDDIFKKGLDGKGMEYSDASWAAMEGMLGGKKVGFIDRYKLLLGLVSVLLISSVGLWYFINQNKANTVNTPSVVDYNEDNTAINKTPGYMDTAESTDYESSKVLATEESGTPLVNKEVTIAAAQTNIPRIGKTVDIEESGRIDYSKGMISDNPTAGVTTLDPTDNGFRNYEPLTVSAAGSTRTTSIDVTSSKEAETLVKPNFQDVILTNVIGMNEFGYEVSANGASELDFLKNTTKKKFSFYGSPYVGYVNYTKNTVLPENASDEQGNLGKSNTANAYNYGLNIGVKKGNWMLSSGLAMLSLREKTYYTESQEEYTYINAPRISNAEYTTTPRGTRVALISQEKEDSTLLSSTNQICEGCEVSFNYISVPLNLQYNFGKKRLRYFVEAGISASFLINAKGTYALLKNANKDITVLPTTEIVDLSTSEDVAKMLLQTNAAVGAKYWLTPRWNLWTSYGYGMGLNSMLGSYEQKPTIQNVRVGVEFKLR